MLQQHNGDHQIQLNDHPAGQNHPKQIIAGGVGGFHLPQGHAPGLIIQQEGDHHHPPPPRAPIAWGPRYKFVQQEGPFRGPMRYIPRLGIVAPSSFTGAARFNIVQEPFIAGQQPSLAPPSEGSSRRGRGRGRGRPPGSRGRSLVDFGGHQPSQAAPAEGSSRRGRGRGRPLGSRGSSRGRSQVDSGYQLPSQVAPFAGSPRRGRGRPPAAGRPARGKTDQVDSGGVGRHPQRGRGRPRGGRKRQGGVDDDGSPGGKRAKHDFSDPSSAA
ncbi:translation initiation factor IF-2-like [Dioscorea cayenensis subsp. rotundata]|uniref:Translation initiation factor IF-2-like n=1 Tax=Dioscorea cayennensis subsp. rotundata TaxID=55577 RepID=A0AB40CQL1_DIOCR|nr:translation initiation factor IF-2-like [Dioscorea cayenensis subsp. rotundata]